MRNVPQSDSWQHQHPATHRIITICGCNNICSLVIFGWIFGVFNELLLLLQCIGTESGFLHALMLKSSATLAVVGCCSSSDGRVSTCQTFWNESSILIKCRNLEDAFCLLHNWKALFHHTVTVMFKSSRFLTSKIPRGASHFRKRYDSNCFFSCSVLIPLINSDWSVWNIASMRPCGMENEWNTELMRVNPLGSSQQYFINLQSWDLDFIHWFSYVTNDSEEQHFSSNDACFVFLFFLYCTIKAPPARVTSTMIMIPSHHAFMHMNCMYSENIFTPSPKPSGTLFITEQSFIKPAWVWQELGGIYRFHYHNNHYFWYFRLKVIQQLYI